MVFSDPLVDGARAGIELKEGKLLGNSLDVDANRVCQAFYWLGVFISCAFWYGDVSQTA